MRVAEMAWLPKAEIGAGGVAYFQKELVIVPRKFVGDDSPPVPIRCWVDTVGEIGIPRDYFFATAQQAHEVVWDVAYGAETSYENRILHEGMFAEQGRAVDTLFAWFQGFDARGDPMQVGFHLGAILQGDPGFGKTNTALSLVHRIGRTTVVVVHKERLLVQWQERIEKFLPGARVGIVRENLCQFEDRDIVIAMAQSLALEGQDGKQRYPKDFYRWPGVVIVDEVHRIGAQTWSPIPQMFPARYRLGLSATPRRKDGADKVFWWHIGQIRYAVETKMPTVSVRVVKTSSQGPDVIRTERTPSPIVINILCRLTYRNQRIVREIMAALKSPSKRKIMVLSERLEHLRELDEMLREACEAEGLEGITTGFYVGEWFTGDQSPRLVKGYWEMDEEGRERAIRTIFSSFRRRRDLNAAKENGHRSILLEPDRWLDLDGLYEWNPEPPEGMTPKQWEEKRVKVFKAADACLLEVAKTFKIAQKKVEKKRPVTEEELREAERARVMWVTYQMCGEGIDQPAVDTIGFASPIGDVEQAYGRARRLCAPVRAGGHATPEMCEHYCPWRFGECQGKPERLAFDIVDNWVPLARKRQRYRMEFYEAVEARVAIVS